eukprot:TRINITY_DN27760_c0_g1_i1.p1 TRINITY_DN27760_c0_g1~~TRINITY_DN27760_c0_g1_i1.p1  ORF type:complete len:1103 (-),score=212.04 TRINITY_DN27760_c0_g1_i1:10-3318(-)
MAFQLPPAMPHHPQLAAKPAVGQHLALRPPAVAVPPGSVVPTAAAPHHAVATDARRHSHQQWQSGSYGVVQQSAPSAPPHILQQRSVSVPQALPVNMLPPSMPPHYNHPTIHSPPAFAGPAMPPPQGQAPCIHAPSFQLRAASIHGGSGVPRGVSSESATASPQLFRPHGASSATAPAMEERGTPTAAPRPASKKGAELHTLAESPFATLDESPEHHEDEDSDDGVPEVPVHERASEMAKKLWGQIGSWTSEKLTSLTHHLEHIQLEPLQVVEHVNNDDHLNSVSVAYSEEDIQVATKNFDNSRMLGSGACGSVYKGTMKDGTETAIKVLKVPAAAGFEDEVRVLSRFRHPNLVILMGFARHTDSGARSLVYEFLSGGDVSGRLHKSRSGRQILEAHLRLSIGLDAASGLSHMHNARPRAFHRDIKCPNILLDRNCTAKMADFGLACVSALSFQMVGQASGTPGYVCPDYLRTGIVTEGSEVHSFGMVLLEMLTGIPPAIIPADRPKELDYLIVKLIDPKAEDVATQLWSFLDLLGKKLDPSAKWPKPLWRAMGEMAFRCVMPPPPERPRFVQLVDELRVLMQTGGEEPVREQPVPPPAVVSGSQGSHEAFKENSTALCHLQCLWSEGLNLEALPDHYRRFDFEAKADVLLVGRACQPSGVWDSLVRDERMRATVSREHFKITARQLEACEDAEDEQYAFYISCVSQNGLLLNGSVLLPNAGEQRLSHGDRIELVDVSAAAAGGQAPERRVFIAFGFRLPERLIATGAVPAPEMATMQSTRSKLALESQATLLPPTAPELAVPTAAYGQSSSSSSRPSSTRAVEEPPNACALRCVFAEGADLDTLSEVQQSVRFTADCSELVVGRSGLCAGLWDGLLPDSRLRGMISREHFKIVSRRGDAPSNEIAFFIACISPNGLLLNDDFMGPGHAERALQPQDSISLLAVAEAATSGEPPPPRRQLITFVFCTPGASSPGVIRAPTEPAKPPAMPPLQEEAGDLPGEPRLLASTEREGDETEEEFLPRPVGRSVSSSKQLSPPARLLSEMDAASPKRLLPEAEDDTESSLGRFAPGLEKSAGPPAWQAARVGGVLRVPVDLEPDESPL